MPDGRGVKYGFVGGLEMRVRRGAVACMRSPQFNEQRAYFKKLLTRSLVQSYRVLHTWTFAGVQCEPTRSSVAMKLC